MPELLDMKDIQVDSYHNESPIVSYTYTHIPTGIYVKIQDTSWIRACRAALKQLTEKIEKRHERIRP
jgi:protein subunit release factor A